MPNSQDIIWYTNGQYQGGTQRGCDSVNLFDPNRNLIAVYQKQADRSYLFLTTCKLVPAEVKHLQDSNGNFLTAKMINEQNALSTNIQDSTNTLDIYGIRLHRKFIQFSSLYFYSNLLTIN